MIGYIYLVTNRVNGKIYVGQHKKQQFDPSYKGSGRLIVKAIKKYGKDKFDVVMIDTADTKEELNQKEVFYIEALNCKDHKIGYNVADGGEWAPVLSGEKNGMYGKHHTEETKQLLSENKQGEKHPFYGKKRPEHSDTMKAKWEEIKKSDKMNKIKQERSQRFKELWQDPEFRKKMLDTRKKKGGEK